MNPKFYDRSRRFAEVVQAAGGPSLRIAISMDRELAGCNTAQLIALAAGTILPRISERYTSIDLCLPAQEITLPRIQQAGEFGDYLLREMKEICPWGQFRAVRELGGNYDYCIVIGRDTPLSARQVIYASASGWRCFVSEVGASWSLPMTFNPLTALATAALASMFIYRRAEKIEVVGVEQDLHISGWSLLNYCISPDDGPGLPSEICLGEVGQAGLGGTGNALLWALRFGPELVGRWIAFEHELTDCTNWNRYLLMRATDVEVLKAEIARREFGSRHRRLEFHAVSKPVDEFYPLFLPAAAVLATVDDPKVRVALQRHSRNVLLNVGTNSQILSASCHHVAQMKKGGACIECLFGATARMDRPQRESTVSFVLALAGAVLGAEFLKSYVFPEFALSNSWLANVFSPTSAKVIDRVAAPDCKTCGQFAQEFLEAKVILPGKPKLQKRAGPPASADEASLLREVLPKPGKAQAEGE